VFGQYNHTIDKVVRCLLLRFRAPLCDHLQLRIFSTSTLLTRGAAYKDFLLSQNGGYDVFPKIKAPAGAMALEDNQFKT
jgi:hypothetical protein